MTAFLAYAWGYAKAKKEAEAAIASKDEKMHPGGSIAMMFPGGVVNINNMG